MTREIDWREYEQISASANAGSAFLTMMWEQLGKPKDPISTQAGRKMMEVIINVWARELTQEYIEWKSIRSDYQDNELSTKQQVKQHTGRSLASYPMFVYQILKKMFPDYKISDRDNNIKMVKHFPIFRFCNTV